MSIDSYVHYRQAVIFIVKLVFISIGSSHSVHALPVASGIRKLGVQNGPSLGDARTWLLLGIAAALVLAGGVFAGLTIALMGQDEIYLQVLKSSGDDLERKHATRVLDLLNKGKHWVLVTLLLSNVITNETLPIVLDRSIGGGWPAIFSSTILIVIFGEIIPQSICVCHGLTIGAWMSPFVMLLMRLMSPIAYPTAVLLDKLVGKGHKTVYKKAGLKTLVTLHKTLGAAGEQLNSDEVTIISAVLDLKEKPVGSIMTPMENVFTMSVDSVLDEQAMDMILSQGYSRIPIHTPDNPENFIGMLLVKMLITYDPEDCKQVKDFALATLPETRPETSCLEIVNFFQEGKSHMVVVSESPGDDHGALGVVTLEDVIEELIGEEIIDESDVFVDVHKAIRRLTPAPKLLLPKGLFVPSVSSRSRFDNVNGENRLAPSAIPGPLQAAYMHSRGGHNNASNSPWSNKAGASGSAEDLLNERKFSEDDIREHLKRLGPSNPSNKPLQTRILNVKIKPGAVDGKSEIISPIDLSRPVSADQSAPSDADDQSPVETRTPLLRRKSGVGTVVSTYGTLDDDDIPRGSSRDDASTKSSNDTNFTTEIASADNNGADSLRPTRHASRHSSGSWSSDVTSPTGSNTPGPSRRATNSGSITEQVINVNGIQKVVLQIGHNGSCAESLSTSPITNSGRGNRGRRASGEGEETIAAPEDDSPQSPFAPLVSSDSEVLSASKEGGAGVGRGSRSFQTQRSSRP